LNFGVFAFQAVPDTTRAETAQPTPGSAGEPAAAPPSSFGLITPLLILIPFIAILFFQSRSQQKKQEAAIAGLKKGDRVITQSGLVGRLLSIEGRYAKLELPPSGMKVTILRTGLLGRDAEGEGTSSAAPEAAGDKSDKSKPSKTTTD
jgi:preprotein translocase subunit YajC